MYSDAGVSAVPDKQILTRLAKRKLPAFVKLSSSKSLGVVKLKYTVEPSAPLTKRLEGVPLYV